MEADNKSEDKKEIEDEEREKMLNTKNEQKKSTSDTEEEKKPAILEIEDGREVKPKKIPIGAIKMPGFFTRSKSKERCKEEEGNLQENVDGETTNQENEQTESEKDEKEERNTLRTRFKIANPFNKISKPSEASNSGEPSQTRRLLESIRLPLQSLFPKKLRSNNQDNSGGSPKAGLASVETLGDVDKTDDGMENIKLEDKNKDVEKQSPTEIETMWEKFQRHKLIILGILIFLLLLIIIIATSVSGSGNVLKEAPIEDGKYITAVTSCGPVQGVVEDGAYAFRGIPYARSPADENRWLPAAPLNDISYCWNGTFQAHNATPACSQILSNETLDGIEDCLTLDVITAHVRYDTPVPVIVLIGSESFTGDTPSILRPSARFARAQDVIFVRPNFRINVLGFMALNTLTKSTYPYTSGNYGLSDIIQALKWVNSNIEHFGGDKNSVTLFGHRTGATLVTALATSKETKGLFSKVWATSGSAIYPNTSLESYEQANKRYLELTECSNAECLRNKNVTELLDAVPDIWKKVSPDLPMSESDRQHEWLVLDGVILKSHPIKAWEENKPAIKMVIGTTAHAAASLKLELRHKEWTEDLVKNHIKNSLIEKQGLTEEVLNRYNSTYKGLVSMISDIRTICPLFNMTSQLKNTTFYVATMTRGEQNVADVDTDVLAILGRYEAKTPEQRRYIQAMQNLFYHFVRHGVISQTTDSTNKILIINQDTIPAKEYPNCDFWINKKFVPNYASID